MPVAPPISMERMPVHKIANPGNHAEARARFYNSGNGFNTELPAVPAADFTKEAHEALSARSSDGTASRFINCDSSAALGCAFPATSPFILARYAVVFPDESLPCDDAEQYIVYVIKGTGKSILSTGDEFILKTGDILVACDITGFEAYDREMVLWCVSRSPLNRCLAVSENHRDPRFLPVFYPASVTEEELSIVLAAPRSPGTSGRALLFSSVPEEHLHAVTPALTLSLNTLFPGERQRSHRHNATAVTLVIAGHECSTEIDGVPVPWSPWTTLVTPPGSLHGHINNGDELARFLIVQDGALHYCARTMDLRHGE